MKKIILIMAFILIGLYGFSQTHITLRLKSPCGVTNVENIAIKSFKIIPNPNNGQFIIRFQDKCIIKNMIVSIYSLDGRMVFIENFENTNNDIKINASSLNSGVYSVRIEGDNMILRGKVTIKKYN